MVAALIGCTCDVYDARRVRMLCLMLDWLIIPSGRKLLPIHYTSGPSMVPVRNRQPSSNTGTIAATKPAVFTPHTASLVDPICAERFRSHYYSGRPVLLNGAQ